MSSSLIRGVSVAFITLGMLVTLQARDEKPDLKELEKTTDAALKAYNDGDWKAFFKEFSKQAESIANEANFKAVYGENSKGMFGKFVKRVEIVKNQTSLEGDYPRVLWVAEFEKNKKMHVSANFIKEDGKYKFIQITIGPAE